MGSSSSTESEPSESRLTVHLERAPACSDRVCAETMKPSFESTSAGG